MPNTIQQRRSTVTEVRKFLHCKAPMQTVTKLNALFTRHLPWISNPASIACNFSGRTRYPLLVNLSLFIATQNFTWLRSVICPRSSHSFLFLFDRSTSNSAFTQFLAYSIRIDGIHLSDKLHWNHYIQMAWGHCCWRPASPVPPLHHWNFPTI